MKPILSVLIVTYKSCAEIKACLESIPRILLGRSVEIIVVENASSDRIGEIIWQNFSWVHYLESDTNLGFGKASNLAYEHAQGDHVLFMNPDTISNEEA